MRILLFLMIVVAVLCGIGAVAYKPVKKAWEERNRVKWKQQEVTRGKIVEMVNATGKVEPILSVHIGSFVSGPITDLHVEYNSEVKKGDLLAEIDTRIYDASVMRDEATLAQAKAELARVTSQLELAKRNEQRAIALQKENDDFVSQAELDQLKYAKEGLEAQLQLASSSIQQATASLSNSRANLAYTKIESPVDGIVIERKIDAGQTLAAQFQAPELFIIGKDMRKEMYVNASVDESEIGMIYDAKKNNRRVEFSVYAYPEEAFEAKIVEIRMSSTETQNVVTYPVVISVPNPDLKLIPGMTADISFEVNVREDCLKIPRGALLFFPDIKHVREEDKPLIDGSRFEAPDEDEAPPNLSVSERAESKRSRGKRHVWVLDGEKLRAIEVETGLIDSKYVEIVSGDLEEGQSLVTGIEKK